MIKRLLLASMLALPIVQVNTTLQAQTLECEPDAYGSGFSCETYGGNRADDVRDGMLDALQERDTARAVERAARAKADFEREKLKLMLTIDDVCKGKINNPSAYKMFCQRPPAGVIPWSPPFVRR